MVKKYKHKQGFTLIELLVYIAVVGILAGMIITVYTINMDKFRDGTAMSSLSQIRATAAVLYQNYNDYADVYCSDTEAPTCTCNNSEIQLLCDEALANSDEDMIFNLNEDNSGFCMAVHLEGEDLYFCVDGGLKAVNLITSPDQGSGKCKSNCDDFNTCACE